MNRLADIFSKIARSSGLFMVLVIVCLYFTFYAVKGERGLFRYWNLKQEISQAKQLREKYDSEKNDWEDKVDRLKKNVWFQKSVRIAIAIGCDVDNEVLNEFTGNPEMVLTAENAAMLVDMIKWASTLVDPSASHEPCKTWIGENEKMICLTEGEAEAAEEAEVVSFAEIDPPGEDE